MQENVYYNGVSLPVDHDESLAMAAVKGSRLTSDALSIHNRIQQVRSYFFHVDACCIYMLLSRNVQ